VAYHVYLIQNAEGRRYIGISSDVPRRLDQHNNGESRWTAQFGPWTLIWISRPFDLTDARKLENLMKKQKGGSGLQSLLNIYGS
jgi:predicted GIY-YIG superfamily endonuclease